MSEIKTTADGVQYVVVPVGITVQALAAAERLRNRHGWTLTNVVNGSSVTTEKLATWIDGGDEICTFDGRRAAPLMFPEGHLLSKRTR